METKHDIRKSRPASSMAKAIGAIVWKDLAAELRSRELLSAMLVFALLVILIFNFALELDALGGAGICTDNDWMDGAE